MLRVIDAFGLHESALVFVGDALPIGLREDGIVHKVWDLQEATDKSEPLLIRLSACGPSPGDPCSSARCNWSASGSGSPFLDPQPPEGLLRHWFGRRAAMDFTQLRSRRCDDTQRRWHVVVKRTSLG